MNRLRIFFPRGAALGLVLTWLAGCAVGPDFVRPPAPDTDRYVPEPPPRATITADGQAQLFVTGAAIAADWWRLFGSTQLNAVVWTAITNNPTLQASEASLRASQDNLRAGYGLFFPHLEGNLAAVRQRTAVAQQGMASGGRIFSLVTVGGSVNYALDVFGGNRRTVEGLRAQADSQRYESQAVCLTLTANVVNTCVARAAYAAQVAATEQLLVLEREQLRLTEAQVRAGVTPYSAVLSLRGLLAANKAALAPLKQALNRTEHLLSTLQGRLPAQATLSPLDLGGFLLPTNLPVSVPSELVRQRPDILSAEALLHVASAKIGVATAAMYPSISVSGEYGGASAGLSHLSALTAASGQFWSLGPSATVPLFQGTSLWYGRRAAQDAYRQAAANYRATVLAAFAQVADVLNGLTHDAEALQAQVEARAAARENLALLQVNYRIGLVTYLDVLSADIQFQNASLGYLQAVAQRHQDTVALFTALGGGWWNAPPPAPQGARP